MSVPVTVKLSELFYRKLGHEVVDEMVNWFNQVDDTYRGQLRELNELNFARFDAKLEQRLAHMKGELRQELADLRAEFLGALRAQGLTLVEVKAELVDKIANGRANLIKWMFIFWIGQAGLIVGLALVR